MVKIGIDRAEPRVKMEWVDERTIRVAITDLSDVSWSYDWKLTKKSGNLEDQETHQTGKGTEKVITLKNDEIGTDQALYESVFTLTVTANGQTVTMPELTGSYDNTVASIELSSDVPTDTFVSGSPWVKVDYKDVAKLEYFWMARSVDAPAGNYSKWSYTEIDLSSTDTSTQSLDEIQGEEAVTEEPVQEELIEEEKTAGEEVTKENPSDSEPVEEEPSEEKPAEEETAEENPSDSEQTGESAEEPDGELSLIHI